MVLELEPRVGPSKVGVEKYFLLRVGVFGLLNPPNTHAVRGGFRDRVGDFGLFSWINYIFVYFTHSN